MSFIGNVSVGRDFVLRSELEEEPINKKLTTPTAHLESQQHYSNGLACMQQGKFADAAQWLTAAVTKDYLNTTAITLLKVCQNPTSFALEDYDDAEAIYQVGMLFYKGTGLSKSVVKAGLCWEKAALYDHVGAARAMPLLPSELYPHLFSNRLLSVWIALTRLVFC